MKKRKELKAREVREFLKYKRITLSCGHKFCLHQFSNTAVILTNGKIICHNCYLGG